METEASIAPQVGSDHWPVVLTIKISKIPKNVPFRFEVFCLSHPDFQEIIKEWWSISLPRHGSKMQGFHQRLKFIKQELKKWNQETFGDITAEKKVLELKMKATKQKII